MIVNLTSHGHYPDIFVSVNEEELGWLLLAAKFGRISSPQVPAETQEKVTEIMERCVIPQPWDRTLTYYI